MNGRRRGKDLERFIAQDLGGRRVGILGHEDVIIPLPNGKEGAVESKERQKLPVFLKKCMAQACDNCNGRVPIVHLHELHQSHDGDLVIMQYKDFKEVCTNDYLFM